MSILLIATAPVTAAGGRGRLAGSAEQLLKPHWRYLGQASAVLVSSRYVFIDSRAPSFPGGKLIDERTGREQPITPLGRPDLTCPGGAIALGGETLAFSCVLSRAGDQAAPELGIYSIATASWHVIPDAVSGPIQGVGADWIEYWNVTYPAPVTPQFAFENLRSGKVRTLPGWRPGAELVPDLNSRSLGRTVCRPLRVPDAWQGNDEDWPGTLSLAGRYTVAAGANHALSRFGYLERCGTRMHRAIGPVGPVGDGYASADAHAVVWQESTAASDLEGAYLPSLQHFRIDTLKLVNSVTSPYTGTPNTYLDWMISRTLYILVTPYYPTDCTPDPCDAPPSQLYAAPAPRQAKDS